jgi:hypothetical protein
MPGRRYGRELEGDKEVGENAIDLDGKAQLPYTRLRGFIHDEAHDYCKGTSYA